MSENLDTSFQEELSENIELNPVMEENTILDEKKEKFKKKKKSIIIVLYCFFLFVITVFLLWILFFSKKEESTKIDYKKILHEYGNLIEKNIYFEDELLNYDEVIKMIEFDHQVECQNHEIYADGTIFLSDCSIDGKNVSYTYGNRVILDEKKPGAIKVYVEKSTNRATLTAPSDIDLYDVYDFDIHERYSNLELMCETCDYVFYLNDSNLGQMINYKTGMKALDGVSYDSILPIYYHNQNDDTYVAVHQTSEEGKNPRYQIRSWGIYNIRTGVDIIPFSLDDIYTLGRSGVKVLFHIYTFDDGVIIGSKNGEYALLNYRTGEAIIPFAQRSISLVGDYLFASQDKVKHVYDHFGNQKFTNYTVFTFFSDGRMFAQNKEGNVLLMNASEEVIYDFGKYTIQGEFYSIAYDDRLSTKFYTDIDDQLSSCMQFDYYVDIGRGVSGVVNCDYMMDSLEPN